MKRLCLLILVLAHFDAFCLLEVGKLAPDIVSKTPDGNTISLHQLRGRVVLVDFWASWCEPCRAANPELVSVYDRYNPKGFEIFSFSLDQNPQKWKNAIQDDELKWHFHGCDFKVWESPITSHFQIDATPTCYLIDENGIIIQTDPDVYKLDKILKKLYSNSIVVHPSVTSNWLFFNNNNVKYVIKTLDGKEVLEGIAKTDVDVSNLPDAIYTVHFGDKSTQFTKKTENHVITLAPELAVENSIILSEIASYEIYSTRGVLILKGKEKNIDCSNLHVGVYHIFIEGKGHKFLKKPL